MKEISMEKAAELIKEAEEMTHEQRLTLQKERLKELVDYVRVHSPYLKKLYEGLGEDYSLSDLLPVTKQELAANYEDWVTDREVKKEDVLSYIDMDMAKEPLYLGKYYALATSGSTGEPLPMLRDNYHMMIHGLLMNMRLLRNVPKDLLAGKSTRQAALINIDPHTSSYRAYLRTVAANPESVANMLVISPMEGTNEMVRKLKEFKPDILSAYPSALCAVADEVEKGKAEIRPKAIACSAENLTPEMYRRFTEIFGCVIVNNYCSTEGGEVAMASGCPHLHINEDWIILESVDENMKPITDSSKWSGGVLITDLTNYIQPIIRYYMSDKIKIHQEYDCACGNSLPWMEIQGRVSGTTTLCGRTISLTNFDNAADNVSGIYAYQFVKTAGDTIDIRLIIPENSDPVQVFNELQANLRKVFRTEGCEEAKIIFSGEPPIRNKRGGKLNYFYDLTKE